MTNAARSSEPISSATFISPFALPEKPRLISGASTARQSIAVYAFDVLEAHAPCVIDEP